HLSRTASTERDRRLELFRQEIDAGPNGHAQLVVAGAVRQKRTACATPACGAYEARARRWLNGFDRVERDEKARFVAAGGQRQQLAVVVRPYVHDAPAA